MSGECDKCGEYASECLCALTLEVRKHYYLLESLRWFQGRIEFGITTCYGNVEWFPYWRLPIKAEKYINAWLKMERHRPVP